MQGRDELPKKSTDFFFARNKLQRWVEEGKN